MEHYKYRGLESPCNILALERKCLFAWKLYNGLHRMQLNVIGFSVFPNTLHGIDDSLSVCTLDNFIRHTMNLGSVIVILILPAHLPLS